MLTNKVEQGTYSTCKGVKIRSALTTFRDLCSGQAIVAQPGWHVVVRTPYTIRQDLRSVPDELRVGCVLKPGESIGTFTNTLSKVVQITEVKVTESVSTAQSYDVQVRGYSYHKEYSPKLRGPGLKASASPDVTGAKQGVIQPILALDPTVEVIFPAETLKGALISLKAFADTVLLPQNRELVIQDGTVPEEILKEHDTWVEQNLKQVIVSHKVHPSNLHLYEGLDFVIEGNTVSQVIEVLICDLICEVEALPTALRGTRSKLCANQVISLLRAEECKPETRSVPDLDFFNTADAKTTRQGLEAFVSMLEYNL